MLTIAPIRHPLKYYLKGQENMSQCTGPGFFLTELKFDRRLTYFIFEDPASS